MPTYTVIFPRLVNIRAHVRVNADSPTTALDLAMSRLETLVDTGQFTADGCPDFDAVPTEDLSWSYEAFELGDEDYWEVIAETDTD